MNSKVAVITHMGNNWRGDLPYFALSSKTQLVQLWHGIPLKKIGFDDSVFSQKGPGTLTRTLSLPTRILFPYSQRVKHPDLVISLSEETRRLFSSAFRVEKDLVKITGYPRNDTLFDAECESCSSAKVIFMPTFRGMEGEASDLLATTGFDIDTIDTFCNEHQIEIDIKLHPFNLPTAEMLGKIARSKFVEFIDVDDVYPQLSKYDVLITDYSSVYFDFLLLDRPMIFFPFKHEEFVARDRELYYDYDEVTPGPKVNSWSEILSYLSDLKKLDREFRSIRKQIKQKFHSFQDAGSCHRVYLAIKDCEKNAGH
jgi:CDP-glycerol glycerophosphotransferase